MDGKGIGLALIGLGLVAVLVGVLVYSGALSWFGRLPGDIRIEGEQSRFYFPLTSMILVSVVLSVVLNVIRRFL
ncbi:MAG: DUF2905 domain-containing protein [Deltaproteobacteria bacterium]|nr:DUF2905 domain-containing protein [Deltaproteobacteria bacterium]